MRTTKAELEQELDALRTTNEESGEIIAELAMALAVLNGDKLRPCVDTCEGHYSEATQKVVSAALHTYEAVKEANIAAAARIAELEGNAHSCARCGVRPAICPKCDKQLEAQVLVGA